MNIKNSSNSKKCVALSLKNKFITLFSIIILIITLSALLFSFTACTFTTDDNSIIGSSDENNLQISKVQLSYEYNDYLGYSVTVTGIAKNISGRKLDYASVEYSIMDASGNIIDTAIDNITSIAKDGTWRFEATVLGFIDVKPISCKLADIITW